MDVGNVLKVEIAHASWPRDVIEIKNWIGSEINISIWSYGLHEAEKRQLLEIYDNLVYGAYPVAVKLSSTESD